VSSTFDWSTAATSFFGTSWRAAPRWCSILQEALVVGGRFFPLAAAGPNDPARTAFVEFQTNSLETPAARVDLSGRTVASDADGSWVPNQLNFGFLLTTTGAPK